MTEMTKTKGKLGIGLIIGAVAGAIAGFLTAPKSGKETRDDIKRRAGQAKDEAGKRVDEAKQKAGEVAEEAKKTVDRAKNVAENAVEGVKGGFNKNRTEHDEKREKEEKAKR
jgi:gas vesicle protein